MHTWVFRLSKKFLKACLYECVCVRVCEQASRTGRGCESNDLEGPLAPQLHTILTRSRCCLLCSHRYASSPRHALTSFPLSSLSLFLFFYQSFYLAVTRALVSTFLFTSWRIYYFGTNCSALFKASLYTPTSNLFYFSQKTMPNELLVFKKKIILFHVHK